MISGNALSKVWNGNDIIDTYCFFLLSIHYLCSKQYLDLFSGVGEYLYL